MCKTRVLKTPSLFVSSLCAGSSCKDVLTTNPLGALALREQITPAGRIPMAEHDRKMDAILTVDGLISSSSMTQ